ncbi:MAG: OmpA family protein [Myxococcales bacterium]|nr:OmpA family protein [Myxococcales bacterium]
MRSHLIALAALGGVSLAAPAMAQIRPGSIEGSVYGGVWEGGARFDTAPTFGARLGYNLHRIFGVEATYGVVPTRQHPLLSATANEPDKDQTLGLFGLDAIVHLSYFRFVPYVTAGVGFVHADEADFAVNLALGGKYWFNEMFGLRADLRGWLSDDAPSTDTFAHFEATLGLAMQFGGDRDYDGDTIPNTEDKCPGVAEDRDGFEDTDGCPDTDNDDDGIPDGEDKCPDRAEDKDGDADDDGCPDLDADGDGIEDGADKCPAEAEDKDGFQDDDGCPEADNDGDGLADAADKCPTEPEDKDGFEDADGCPDRDNDGDGIEDAKDACPDGAEDKDGFQDEDGCPDLDNDLDGVLDAADKCPDEKETINGNEDDDGCPDEGRSLVAVSTSRIEIKQTVYFDTGKASIQARSFNLLNQVALILKANPQITKVRVEGHTDDKGEDAYNRDLSQSRADAVRDYLVAQGVAADRLVPQGFGEERPIADNRSAAGREKNRRVEFNIIEPPPAGDAAPAQQAPQGGAVPKTKAGETPAPETPAAPQGGAVPKTKAGETPAPQPPAPAGQ